MKILHRKALRLTKYWPAIIITGLSFTIACTGPDLQEKIQAQQKRPNIILILADDLGWRDVGFMGSTYYETPNLDRLAAKSLIFTNAYAAAPVCTPTRAALMTGKTPARLNITAVFDRDGGKMPLLPPDWRNELAHEETTLAEHLQTHGYTTAIMGKWHLGLTEPNWPEYHGFDVNVAGWKSGRPDSYFTPYENPRLPDGPEGEYLTDRIAAEAVEFIDEHSQAPFFLYLPFYSPHAPLEAPDSVIARFAGKPPDGGQKNPAYAAMIARLDAAVGNIVNAVEKNGLAEQTIILFTSDNGGVLSLWETLITDNQPLRGEKFHLYEGGIRVPLFVHWPGRHMEGQFSQQLISTQDFLPSLLSIAGYTGHIEDKELDGLDLSAVFEHGDPERIERDLFWHYPHYMPRQAMRPCGAVRSGEWKLLHWLDTHEIELYNLYADLGETTDLASEQPDTALALYDKLEAWRREVGARMPRPNPAFQGEVIISE